MCLIKQRLAAIKWRVLILSAVYLGAHASDQTCQASSDPKACSDERTSLMQTASVVQKRGAAVAPHQPPQTMADKLAEGETQNAGAILEQAVEHESLDASDPAAARPGAPHGGALSADARESRTRRRWMTSETPPAPWFALMGQVLFCMGSAVFVLFFLLLWCGKLQSLLPTPKYATAQEKDEIKKGWAFFTVMMSTGGVAMMVTDQYLPSLSKMQVDFGTDAQTMALTLQVNWFSVAVSSLIMAVLGDIVGRKPVIILSQMMTAAASFGCASATSVDWFMAGCALQGISSGCVAVMMMMCKDLFEDKDERMKYTAAVFGVLLLCPTAAPALGGMVAHYSSWRLPFLFFAGWSCINVVCQMLFLPETRSAPSGDGQTIMDYRLELTRLLGDRPTMVLGICQGLCMGVMMSDQTNFSQIMGGVFHQNQGEISWKLAIDSIACLVPTVVVEMLSESAGCYKILQGSYGLAFLPAIVSIIVGAIWFTWPPLFTCVVLCNLPIVAAYIGTNSMYFETVGEQSGAAAGINKFMEMGIGSAVSLVSSTIVKNSSNQVAGMLFCLAGLIILLNLVYFVGFGLNPPKWALKGSSSIDEDIGKLKGCPSEEERRTLPALSSLTLGTACKGKCFSSPCQF